jgi:hypothetical protein
MPKKQTEQGAKMRGGADSIRARGLVQLSFPLTLEERRRIHVAAAKAGQRVNQWLRAIATEAARQLAPE